MKPKVQQAIRVTFEHIREIDCICLAKLGMSNLAIKSETGLSDGQISYRLRKGKLLEEMPKGVTYRSDWRNGTGPVVRSVRDYMIGGLRNQTRDTLIPLVRKPVKATVA
jgi:hypothetical protein